MTPSRTCEPLTPVGLVTEARRSAVFYANGRRDVSAEPTEMCRKSPLKCVKRPTRMRGKSLEGLDPSVLEGIQIAEGARRCGNVAGIVLDLAAAPDNHEALVAV